MAKLHEEVVVVKVSRMLRDDVEAVDVLDKETLASLESVIAELAGDGSLVEVLKD